MAGVVSVEHVTITLANGSESVTTNLNKGQDETKCAPFYSSRRVLVSGTNQSDNQQYNNPDIEIIDNGGTPAVRCTVSAMAASNSILIEVYVVEFGSDINVYQGAFDIVASATTDLVSITAIDQTKAFIIHAYEASPADADGMDESRTGAFFSANDEITFIRGLGPTGSSVNGHYYVIEDTASNWTVDSGSHDCGTTGQSTIGAVDMAKTFIIASCTRTDTIDDIILEPTVFLGATTTVDSIRGTNTGTCTVYWFAVEFDSGGAENVYRGSVSGTSATDTTPSHASVDPNFTAVHTPKQISPTGRADSGGTASSDFNQALVGYVLNGTDDGVDMTRSVAQGGTQSIQSYWETIEWEQDEVVAVPPSAYTPAEQHVLRTNSR